MFERPNVSTRSHQRIQLVGPCRPDPGILECDQALLHELREGVLERDHALAAAEGDFVGDVLELVGADVVAQDQNLLQFFLNVVEFGMTPQEASEAANFNTFQVRKWLGDRLSAPGRILLHADTPPWVRNELRRMGYDMTFEDRTSGPINAIWFDRAHGTLWGGSSNHGEDYGIAW